VQTSAESLLGLLNDILDFSKIEAGKLEMEIIEFDLHAMLDDFGYLLATRPETAADFALMQPEAGL